MAAQFFVVPQWQGSGSSRAMRLVDGAEAIRSDLPASSTVTIDIPLGAGSDEGTLVQRLSSVVAVRDALALELRVRSGLPIVIGGDCGVEIAAIGQVDAATTAVLWLDAHPDLNAPEESESGAFCGMVLRTLLGDGVPALVPAVPLDPARVILAGVRSMDNPEQEFVAANGMVLLPSGDLTGQAVADAVAATGATSLYIHIDLDVLDPAEFAGLTSAEPFGISLSTLLEVIAGAKSALPLVGAGITEFAPSEPEVAGDDLGSILRIIGALAS